MDQKLILPPAHIVELEALIREAICQHLATLGLGLSDHHLAFLCAPWAHFFTHGAMHRWELHGEAGRPMSPASSDGVPPTGRSVPGDTLAFMEFSRTPTYREYLDATLAGGNGKFTGRAEVHIFPEALPARVRAVTFIPGWPRKFRYLLQILSFGRIRDLENKPESVEVTADWPAREALGRKIYETLLPRFPKVASWLSARARELFPKSLLEYLPVNFRKQLELPGRRVLFSVNGWQIIDDWKVYALAQKIRYQATWIGAPHAIGYGSLSVFWHREYEISYLDVYLTWGWSGTPGAHARVIPFYCPNFAGLPPLAAPEKTSRADGILISSAARPQHLLEYPYTPERFECYLNTQLKLADSVQGITQGVVSIRTRPSDLGWDMQKMVQSLGNKNVTLEFQKGKFYDRLKRSWLHICDNCSTTIVESFRANHPTLILITDEYFQLSPEAHKEFDQLASAGVFHDNLQSLLNQMRHLEKAGNLEAWWNAPATQEAIRAFLFQQCRGGSGLTQWRRVLLARTPAAISSE